MVAKGSLRHVYSLGPLFGAGGRMEGQTRTGTGGMDQE